MSSAVQNIMQRTLGDLARATKFEVLFQFTNPNTAPAPDDLIVLAKASSFPGVSHSTIDLKYKGRSIPIKGQVKYNQTWECTFYLTEDHKLKRAFENWIVALDQKHTYMDPTSPVDLSETQRIHSVNNDYTSTIHIFQKNFEDTTETAKYSFYNVFPTEVSQVQTNYESVGQAQEFTVTFSYSYYTSEVLKGTAGNFIDNIIGKFQDSGQSLVNGALNAIGDSINGFVNDAVGDTLNKLNDWSKNLTTDLIPAKTDKIAAELVSGGLGPEYIEGTIFDIAQEMFNASIGGFGSIREELYSSIPDAPQIPGTLKTVKQSSALNTIIRNNA